MEAQTPCAAEAIRVIASNLRAELEKSGNQTLDVFCMSRVAPNVPIEESVGGMAELSMKARHVSFRSQRARASNLALCETRIGLSSGAPARGPWCSPGRSRSVFYGGTVSSNPLCSSREFANHRFRVGAIEWYANTPPGSGSTASQNHPRLRPLRRQIPIVARRSPPSRGFVHRRLSDAGAYTGSIARAGPPSETLPDSTPSGPARNGRFNPFREGHGEECGGFPKRQSGQVTC